LWAAASMDTPNGRLWLQHQEARRRPLTNPQSVHLLPELKVNNQELCLRSSELHSRKNRSITTTNGRTPERVFLVGIESRSRSAKNARRQLTPGAQAARDGVSVEPRVSNSPEFSAQESLEELRTLATSAGAEIAGEFLQHRERPDPATL